MASLFLTDPDARTLEQITTKKESGNKFIRFKEAVCRELQLLGVGPRAAEVAVIDDYGGIMKQCLIERVGPRATAELMIGPMQNIYMTEGKWHYAS